MFGNVDANPYPGNHHQFILIIEGEYDKIHFVSHLP